MQKRQAILIAAAGVVLTLSFNGCKQQTQAPATQSADNGYSFDRGFPSGNTAQKAYDDADLNRAVEAYRFFYPTVSGHAIFVGNEKIGIVPNKVFGTLDSKPKHVGFTLNSDTPTPPPLSTFPAARWSLSFRPGLSSAYPWTSTNSG